MPNLRKKPTPRDRSANPKPGFVPKINSPLPRLFETVGQERPEILPKDPRQTDGISPIGQAEQAKKPVALVRIDEPR